MKFNLLSINKSEEGLEYGLKSGVFPMFFPAFCRWRFEHVEPESSAKEAGCSRRPLIFPSHGFGASVSHQAPRQRERHRL
jgi:hypothetical protein